MNQQNPSKSQCTCPLNALCGMHSVFWVKTFRISCSLISSKYSCLCLSLLPLLHLSMSHLSYFGIYIIELSLFMCFFLHSCNLKEQINAIEGGGTVGNVYTFTYQKNLHISRPMHIFKGELYTKIDFWR